MGWSLLTTGTYPGMHGITYFWNDIVDSKDEYQVEQDSIDPLYAYRDSETRCLLISLALRNQAGGFIVLDLVILCIGQM